MRPQPETLFRRDPGGTVGQAAAIDQLGSSASNVQSAISIVPQALSVMATPAQFEEFVSLISLVSLFLVTPVDVVALLGVIPADVIGSFGDFPFAAFSTV